MKRFLHWFGLAPYSQVVSLQLSLSAMTVNFIQAKRLLDSAEERLQTQRHQTERIHLIKSGRTMTMCCAKTPFELPVDDRMTTDPELANCKGPLAGQP